MTGEALRIIEAWFADERFVRVVTGNAGNAPVLWIAEIAGTLRQPIGLKANVAGAAEIWHGHHLFVAPVATAAKALREGISRQVRRREDPRLGWLTGLGGGHMRCGWAVTRFTTDAGRQPLHT